MLSWYGVTGRSYSVLSADNVLSQVWIVSSYTNVAGNNSTMFFLDDTNATTQEFFRVQVEISD